MLNSVTDRTIAWLKVLENLSSMELHVGDCQDRKILMEWMSLQLTHKDCDALGIIRWQQHYLVYYCD